MACSFLKYFPFSFVFSNRRLLLNINFVKFLKVEKMDTKREFLSSIVRIIETGKRVANTISKSCSKIDDKVFNIIFKVLFGVEITSEGTIIRIDE